MARLDNIFNAPCSEQRRHKNTVTASALAAVSHTHDTFHRAMKDKISDLIRDGDEETQQILADVEKQLYTARNRLAYLIGATSIRGGIS